ncbi:putative phage holin [Nocardioides jensenii]|uniref:putative phage holin n=1 Tax=Nocardioides jensenii TaxID=1843 RepID=UPI00083092F5|nr:hypothetical protein [Nocardioides jensenii]
MSADMLALLLIVAAAPPATVFPLLYGLSAPWWRSLVGRALMTSSLGLAFLIDISLAYKAFGDNYALRDVVRLSVYALIVCGAWMQFLALAVQLRRRLRKHP